MRLPPSPQVAWMELAPLRARTMPAPRRTPAPARRTPVPSAAPPVAPAPDAPVASAPEPAPADSAPERQPAPGLAERALRDVGRVDAQLRREFPERANLLHARPPTAQQKLEAGIAGAAAVPRWFQAPRITELRDATGNGRRIYKVESSAGTYCVFYPAAHAPDGRDHIRDGVAPSIMTCPRE